MWSREFNSWSWYNRWILFIINIITFILVIIRKSSYYFVRYGNKTIPDFILVPIIILGGTIGGCLAKILFDFGDWSCNSIMEVENFVYNIGMYNTYRFIYMDIVLTIMKRTL